MALKIKYKNIIAGVLPYAGIALAGFLLYFPALFFGITYFDDHISIIENRYFLSNIANIFNAFRVDALLGQGGQAIYYRPLLIALSILDAQFDSNVVFISHLTNIIIHLTASGLFFLLLTRLGYERVLSFVFSLILTVHPVLVAAVAWIPGRTDSLLAVFIFAGFLFFIEFLNTRKIVCYFFHILFFAFSIFTKESAFVLPIICLLYIWLIFKTKERWSFPIKILPVWWILTAGVWVFLRRLAFANPTRVEPVNIAVSIWHNLGGFPLYLGKMAFPFNLSVTPILKDSTLIYGYLVLICMIVLSLFARRGRFIVFGWAWIILFLLPGFARINPGETISFLEYRAYLPLFGFIILLLETNLPRNLVFKRRVTVQLPKATVSLRGASATKQSYKGLLPLYRMVQGRNDTSVGVLPIAELLQRRRLLLFACAVIVVFFAVSFNYSKNYKDRITFWSNAVRNSPRFSLAHRNLGAMYYLDGEFDKAEEEYKAALRINPYEPMVYNNLGLIYMNKGGYAQAEEAFKKELVFNAGYDNGYFNLGLLYARTGRLEEAVGLWEKALKINPAHKQAFECLLSNGGGNRY